MKSKSVLVLEDNETLRLTLASGLARYGLIPIPAKNMSEAWAALAQHGDVDVALLDVQIKVEGGLENGLEFGLELKEARRDWPPEFLVHSAFPWPKYYDMAMTLGAAAYLQKGDTSGDDVSKVERLAHHIRALALRRALLSERPGMTERIRAIAESSRSRYEAIDRFCREVLFEEIHDTFGDTLVLMVSRPGRILWFSNVVSKPIEPIVTRLEAAAHSRLTETGPLVVKSNELLQDLSASERASSRELLDQLDGAAFTNLAQAKDVRIALGLLSGPLQEKSTKNQVTVLDRYLQREVIAHLLQITEVWAELESKRKMQLTATSEFCLHEGQEILGILAEAERSSKNSEGLVPVTRLRTIATEMYNAGVTLMQLAQPEDTAQGQSGREVAIRDLVERVWSEKVSRRLQLAGRDVLSIKGDCEAFDREERTEKAVVQILGWLGRRLLRPGADGAQLALVVDCLPPNSHRCVRVTFEEHHSRRLSHELRQKLFDPFYTLGVSVGNDEPDGNRRLGLYLARTLAQIAGGTLSDDSDNLTGSRGHRLVLDLPATQQG